MHNSTESLGILPVKKLLISLAVPAITAQIVNMLYNLVDRMYIGRIADIGATALTGVGVTFPIIILIMAFSNLIGVGGSSRCSVKMGQGDYIAAEKILANCFSLGLIIALSLTVIFRVFGQDLLFLFGASDDTIIYAEQYLNIYILGTIFVQTTLSLNPFITAQGFAKVSMLTTIIGAAINIILDPIFIFGLDLGVAGAAWATVISQAISAAWVIKFLTGEKTNLKLKKQFMPIKWPVICPVLSLGISPFIMGSTESLVIISFNSSLQLYGGDIAVGAMTILASVMQLCMLPVQGLGQGAVPIIGYNFGAANAARVREAFKLLLKSTALYITIFWLVLMFFPHIFAALFTQDQALIDYAAWAMPIYFGGYILFSLQMSCQQTLIALGQAKLSMFLALLRKVILLIPLIYILPPFFAAENKVFSIFLAESIADVLAATTTTILFFFYFRKAMAKIENNNNQQKGV